MTATAPAVPRPVRLRPADLARLSAVGLRTRKLRAGLSALGIAIGVAAIVAVLGLSASSSAGLLAEISRLGTNLLTVTNGQNFTGGTAELPQASPSMISRLPGVMKVQDTGTVSNLNAYRSPLIPPVDTNALSVDASSLNLPAAVGTSVVQGAYLNAATAREPVAVLGAAAAQRLGIDKIWPGERIWPAACGSTSPASSSPPCWPRRSTPRCWSATPPPRNTCTSTATPQPSICARPPAGSPPSNSLLAAQANPENPSEVDVSQPSSALTAQADAEAAFNVLFLGLGAVALLVGAVGVANIMVIAVLERRSEIGLRRALGATKGHIRVQFLSEAILLALAGGAAGVIIGAAATAIYAHAKGWAIVIPAQAWAGGLGAALVIGALAGLLPALRAARLSPTQALWTL